MYPYTEATSFDWDTVYYIEECPETTLEVGDVHSSHLTALYYLLRESLIHSRIRRVNNLECDHIYVNPGLCF